MKTVIAENQAEKVIEIRVITHVSNPPTARVVLIFSNGTSSTMMTEFPNYEAAEFFASGLRDGLEWGARLIVIGIKSAAELQENAAMQPLDANDFVEMIERDYMQKIS